MHTLGAPKSITRALGDTCYSHPPGVCPQYKRMPEYAEVPPLTPKVQATVRHWVGRAAQF